MSMMYFSVNLCILCIRICTLVLGSSIYKHCAQSNYVVYECYQLHKRDELQEKLRNAQEELELRQREEEQALLTKFQQERETVETNVKEETENEWEDRLKNITHLLDKQYKKKQKKEYEEVGSVTMFWTERK